MNYHRTVIELDKSALINNIKNLSFISKIPIAVVVKSNAYGHGLIEISKIIDHIHEVNFLCTSGIREALFLKKNKIKKNILVFSYLDDSIEMAIANNIHFPIYNFDSAIKINQAAKKINMKANVHIKIDTGMSRLGIFEEDALEFLKKIQSFSNLTIQGIFTHLSDPHNINSKFAYKQLEKFDETLRVLEQNGIYIPLNHAISSSGLGLNPSKKYSFIRSGALTYGLWKSIEFKQFILQKYPNLILKPVLRWKTQIIDIKIIPANSFVGYDKTFITKRPTRMGILPIGYFDGYPSSLSNKGKVLIKNKEVPIIGKISMNLITIDLTDCSNIKLYDEVTLFGSQEIEAHNVAQKAGIITNELITNISQTIERKVIKQNLKKYLTNTKIMEKNNSL